MQETTTPCATLLIKLHDTTSEERELSKECFTIGRKPDNDLAIEDPAVSGHHARVTKIHAVYFIEDLKSTNGTYVNEKRIDRHQLRDTDVITIGRHRLIFRDGTTLAAGHPAPVADLDRTIALTGGAAKPDAVTTPATVRVLSGKTDQTEYLLVKQVTTIGAEAQAAIKLTGWFAPAAAAIITRRHSRYFVSSSRTGKRVRVNGQEVTGERELRDTDRIEVAGATLLFRTMSEKTPEGRRGRQT